MAQSTFTDTFWADVLTAVAPNAPAAVIAKLAALCVAGADPNERLRAISAMQTWQIAAHAEGSPEAAAEMAEAAAILEHRDAIWASHTRQPA